MKKLLSMLFMVIKTIINIFIILIGPITSVWLVKLNKGDSSENWASFYLATFIFGIITIAIAITVSKLRTKKDGSVIIASVYSIITYNVLTLGYILLIERSGAGLMWLPVIIIFTAITSLPMAFSMSLGTIRILRDFKFFEKEKK